MKKRYLSALLCLVIAIPLSAQTTMSKKKRLPSAYNKQNNKDNNQFLEKQFWLGLKAGTNLSAVTLESTYDIYSPVDGFRNKNKYDRFKGLGTQIAIELSFYFKSFSLSFQPTYQH